jgi:hypothetical protein
LAGPTMVSALLLVPVSVEADADSVAAVESGGFWLRMGRFWHWIFLPSAESVDFGWMGRGFGAVAAKVCREPNLKAQPQQAEEC